jgi:hypothetical protein
MNSPTLNKFKFRFVCDCGVKSAYYANKENVAKLAELHLKPVDPHATVSDTHEVWLEVVIRNKMESEENQ